MDEVQQGLVTVGVAAAAAVGTGLSIGHRAAALGHDVEVSHAGGRFQLECSCGWSTPRNWTRRRAFQAVTEHVIEVVAAANRRVDGDNVGGIG